MKNIVVSSSTSSRVSWLQVWKQMHLWLLLLLSTTWWWVQPQREVEKKVLMERPLFWKKKTSNVVLKLSTNEFYSTEIWRIGFERFGGTHLKFSGCNLDKNEFWKENGNLEALSEGVNFMSEIFARPGRRNNHLRKPHDKQIEPAKQRGIWREIFLSSSPRTKLRFILLWRRQRDSMFIVHPGASMHNAEQVDLSWDTMDILRRSETTMCDLPRPGTVRINE